MGEWVRDNRGAGPWTFSKGKWPTMDPPWTADQPNRPTYNEGNRISSYDDSTWPMEEFSGDPVTETHDPCGYWHKHYVPYMYNTLFMVENHPAGGNQTTQIVKKKLRTLSEELRVDSGNTILPGVSFFPDVVYIPTLDNTTWNTTIDLSSYSSHPRLNTRIAFDSTRTHFYVMLGAMDSSSFDGSWWLMQKCSLTDGGVLWTYSYNYPNSCLFNICTFEDNVYAIAGRHLNYGDQNGYIMKRSADNGSLWLVALSSAFHIQGGAICADTSGVYIAFRDYTNSKWVVQKRSDSNGSLEWSVTTDYGAANFPHTILKDDAYLYIFGGGAYWLVEKRLKANGVLETVQSSPAGTNSILDVSEPLNGRVYAVGHIYSSSYQARLAKIALNNLFTMSAKTTTTRGTASGVALGYNIAGTILVATPTYNAASGSVDLMLQRRLATTLLT